MYTSATDAWENLRQTFATQFEQYGTGFVYRRSQKGEAIRVSADERSRFIDGFDRSISRLKWIIYAGVAAAIAGVAGASLLAGSDLIPGTMVAALVFAMIPYFAYYRWAYTAPSRELVGRTPVAGKRSAEEVRRLHFKRITYGQLAGAAFGGLLFPFVAASDATFQGWNRLWLVIGGALILFSAVQAFRKWRVEQVSPDGTPNKAPRDTVAEPAEDSRSQTLNTLRRYVPLALILLAFAFIGLTPAGTRLAQAPIFWPLVISGLGAWSLSTVARGFWKGEIEPFAKGFYQTYQRGAQPKRFWASMAWNAILGVVCVVVAFPMYQGARVDALDATCINEGVKFPNSEALAACNRLIELRPRDSDAYINRGLAYLDGGKFNDAVVDFTRAHELDRSSPWPLANRGISHAWKMDHRMAAADFATVRSMDPDNLVLNRGEALLDLQSGKLDSAISRLSANLARDPDDFWSLRMRSNVYKHLGQLDKAMADQQTLRDRSEDRPPR